MIYYLTPVKPGETVSGGTRKLWDHVGILRKHGRPATLVTREALAAVIPSKPKLVVAPDVFGEYVDLMYPGTPWVAFVQNFFMVTALYDHCQFLKAIMVESRYTEELIREKFPDLAVPVILTHSSGNGRMGEDGPFRFGLWPRQRWVMYFDYKHEEVLAQLFDGLELPDGWELHCLSGKTDEEIAEDLRTGAIFLAPNQREGLCAPTQEAMISGARIVGWTGGGAAEYLNGRATLMEQDDIDGLRMAVAEECCMIDEGWELFAVLTACCSAWHQGTYSRQGEIIELLAIMDGLAA